MEHGRLIEAAAATTTTTTNSSLAGSHSVFTPLILLCTVLLQLTQHAISTIYANRLERNGCFSY
jgi:hypothetical protein